MLHNSGLPLCISAIAHCVSGKSDIFGSTHTYRLFVRGTIGNICRERVFLGDVYICVYVYLYLCHSKERHCTIYLMLDKREGAERYRCPRKTRYYRKHRAYMCFSLSHFFSFNYPELQKRSIQALCRGSSRADDRLTHDSCFDDKSNAPVLISLAPPA